MSSLSVADVMSDHIIAVRKDASFAEIVTVMRRLPIASMPVIDADNRVVGLVSEDDLLIKEAAPKDRITALRRRRREQHKMTAVTASQLMTSPAVTVTTATPVREAARLMHRHRIHQLPVVDPVSGRLRGIVSRSDVLAVYERPDDDIRREIVNDIIEDTFTLDPGRITVTVADGTVTARGTIERRSVLLALTRAIEAVEGVITLDNHLRYQWDDTSPAPPAYL